MLHSRWATCARLPALIVAAALAAYPVLAQSAGNPPKLRKELQAVAAKLSHEDLGPVVSRAAVVGDHMLTLQFEPAPAVAPDSARKEMKGVNWDAAVCTNKDALSFISSKGVTVRIAFVQPGQPDEAIADVTASSCARQAAADPTVSRVIAGVAFAPQPTSEQALAKVRGYVQANFLDPDAAQIKCDEPGPPAWVKPIGRRLYGYFLRCDINGKNAYGGYVGYHTLVFRMNGDDFERVYPDGASGGTMEADK